MKTVKTLIFLIIIALISSCYRDTGEFFRTTSITLSADNEEKRPGQTINLTIDTDSGLDVTSKSTFYIKEIIPTPTQILVSTNPTVTRATISKYKVYAKYLDVNSQKEYVSNEIEINFDNKKSFRKRVLIEDYTGAWCVNCPTVSHAIELLKDKDVVPVAIHRGDNPASYDPYHFAGADPLEALVEIANQYPTAKLNRITDWNYPQHTQTNLNKAIALTTGTPVRVGLAMNSTITGSTINLDVKVKFFDDFSTSFRLVVYALENDLIYPQKNSTSFYGGLSVIPNFQHDHVLRASFTNILGDAIPASVTFYDNVYSKNFSVTIPVNISNASKIEFVAFVIGPDNKALNVRNSKVAVTQDFEENN